MPVEAVSPEIAFSNRNQKNIRTRKKEIYKIIRGNKEIKKKAHSLFIITLGIGFIEFASTRWSSW